MKDDFDALRDAIDARSTADRDTDTEIAHAVINIAERFLTDLNCLANTAEEILKLQRKIG